VTYVPVMHSRPTHLDRLCHKCPNAIAAFIALFVVGGVARAQTPGIVILQDPTPGSLTAASAISDDGRIVGGGIRLPVGRGFRSVPMTWTAQGGPVTYSPPISPNDAGLEDLSGDGSTILGISLNGTNGGLRSWCLNTNGTQTLLPIPVGYDNVHARSTSRTGDVAVGTISNTTRSFTEQAFRWNSSSGLTPLGYLPNDSVSNATAVSRDGNVVVGMSANPGTGVIRAFRWTAGTGMRQMENPAGNFAGCYGTAISRSGQFSAGYDAGSLVGVLWNGTSFVSQLVPPAGYRYVYPQIVSDAGDSVFGGMNVVNATVGAAFVWTPDRGVFLFSQFLAENGVIVPQGLTLTSVHGLSADGRTMVGSARLSSGADVAFIATIPSPCTAADFNQDGGVDGSDVEAFFMAWEAGTPLADVNIDGGVDGGDVETFFVAWQAGGC